METVVLLGWLALLFLALPLTVGFAVKHLWPGGALWIVIAGLMTYSQSQDDELGGMWIVVLAVSLLGMPLVFAGTKLRSRVASRRTRTARDEGVRSCIHAKGPPFASGSDPPSASS